MTRVVTRTAAQLARFSASLKRRESRAKASLAQRLKDAEKDLAHWQRVCAKDRARQKLEQIPRQWRADAWGRKAYALMQKGHTFREMELMGFEAHELLRRGFLG